jgi:hypothetical protein
VSMFDDSDYAEVEPTYDDPEAPAPGGAGGNGRPPSAGLFDCYPGCTQDHLDVYRGLYRHAKQDGTRTFPKLGTLADELERTGRRRVPERTLKRRLSDLKAWGWVRADRQMVAGEFGGQRRGHNAYTLMVPLADLPMVAPRSDQGKREGWTRPGRSMVAPRRDQAERETVSLTDSYGGPTVPPATMRETAGRTVGPVRTSQNRRSDRGAKAMVAPQEPPTVNQPPALKRGRVSQPVGGTSRGASSRERRRDLTAEEGKAELARLRGEVGQQRAASVQVPAEPPPARLPRVELRVPETDQLDHDPTAAEVLRILRGGLGEARALGAVRHDDPDAGAKLFTIHATSAPLPDGWSWPAGWHAEPVGACCIRCAEPASTTGPDSRPWHPLCWGAAGTPPPHPAYRAGTRLRPRVLGLAGSLEDFHHAAGLLDRDTCVDGPCRPRRPCRRHTRRQRVEQ